MEGECVHWKVLRSVVSKAHASARIESGTVAAKRGSDSASTALQSAQTETV